MLRRVTSYRRGAVGVAGIALGATGAITDMPRGGVVAAGAVGIVANWCFRITAAAVDSR